MPLTPQDPAAEVRARTAASRRASARQVQQTQQPPNDSYQRVTTADRASGGTLPTKVVTYLAGLNRSDTDIARLARTFARQFSVPPEFLFGTSDPSKYVSPVTGKHLSLQEAQRFSYNFAPVALASMLKQQLAYGAGLKSQRHPRGAPVQQYDPQTVARFARAISRYDPNEDVDITSGIGLAVQLTEMGVSPKTFEQNLQWVQRSMQASPHGYDVHTAVNAAVHLATIGVRAKSLTDVIGAVKIASGHPAGPPTEAEVEQQQAAVLAGEAPAPGLTSVGPDYWALTTAEQKRIAADQTAFQNSFFNKWLLEPAGWTLHMANMGYKDFWAGAVLGARIPIAATAATLAGLGLDPQHEGALNNWQAVMAAGRYQAQRIYGQRATPGSLLVEPLGHRYHWVGNGLDLLIAWELDPTVIAGKVRANYLRDFLAPELLEHGSVAKGIAKQIPGIGNAIRDSEDIRALERAKTFAAKAETFASSSLSRRLFDSLGDTTRYGRSIFRLRGKVEARGTLDFGFMTALRTRLLERYPALGEDAWNEWQTALKAHFTGYAPADTVAAEVVRARLEGGVRAEADAAAVPGPLDIPSAGTYRPPYLGNPVAPENVAQAAAREAYHVPEAFVPRGFFSMEVPGTTALSEYGPRRVVRSLLTSEKATSTGVGRRAARLIDINPGRVMEFHNDAPTYVYENATRWGTFTEGELRDYQAQVADIINSGRGTEYRIRQLQDTIDIEGLHRVLAPYKLDAEVSGKLETDLLTPVRKLNDRWTAFGVDTVGEGLAPASKPLIETQLRNQLFVVDPLVVRAGVRRYISMRDRVWQHLAGRLGKEAPEITVELNRIGHGAVVKALDLGGDLYRGWLRFWKSLTVARPAYIPRVVLLDENARALATFSSASDRLMAISFGHRAAENPNAFKRILDSLDTEIHVGDATVTVPRAGAFEYDAAATGNVRQADVIDEMVRGRERLMPGLQADGGWDVLEATDATRTEHLHAMSWDLAMQLRQSEPGKVALESVARGEDLAATKADLIAWAREDHFVTLTSRIGVEPADVSEWASDLSKVTHAYTVDDRELASLALEGDRRTIEGYIEANVPLEERPPVHAPSVSEVTDGGAANHITSRFTNMMYDTSVRRPEDAINRQPYTAEWKRRAQVSMYKGLDQASKDHPELARTMAQGVKPRILQPESDIADIPWDPNYYAHLTPSRYIEPIRGEGILPQQQFYGINPDAVRPEMQGGRAFVADDPHIAMNATKSTKDKVLIRIPKADVPVVFEDTAMEGSHFSRATINTEHADILGEDGSWHAMADVRREVPGVSPDLRRAIDHASTAFALGQTRRVMFDFTKQSHFTELLQAIFPFPQPFFEGFQAWGHIAYRNPTALAHARILFQNGVDSGLIRKDPLSGEYMVPMDPYRTALMAVGTLFGGDPKLMSKLADPWVPLANMNMLTSSTLEFGAEGPVGRLIGGVPIPVPGLNPVAAAVLMKAFANSKSPVAQGWLFQYGPGASQLPQVLKALTAGIFPDYYKDDTSRKSLALGITEALHRYHLDVNPDGSPIPLNAEEVQKLGLPANTKTLEDIANEQANALYESRLLVSLFAPTSLRTAFQGQREDYAAFQQMIDDNGGDFFKASDQWYKTYPDKFMIPAGKTLAGPGYDGQPGVRVPAGELTYQLYRTPGVGDFMRANPAWAALMLVGTDPKVANLQDFSAFSDLIAKGMVRYKNPDEYYASGESSVAWGKVDVFDKTIFYPGMDALVKKHGSVTAAEDSDAYLALKEKRYAFFADLYRTDPHWVLSHLQKQTAPDGTSVWDWPNTFGNVFSVADTVRADAHRIISTPGLESFPGVQALQSYMDQTDLLIEKMQKARVTDINSDKAKELGLFKTYSSIVGGVLADQPDLVPFLDKYFGVRLDDKGKVASTDDLVYNFSEREWAFSSVPDQLKQNVIALDEHLDHFKREASRTPYDSFDRAQAYAKVDNLINKTWDQDPKVIKQWWNVQGQSYRQEYRTYLASKPVEFYTAFDYHVAGLDLSKTARGYLDTIATARLDIARLQQNDTGYSPSVGYKAIAQYVHDRLAQRKPDRTFRVAIEATDQWGWGVDHILGYGADPHDSKADWLWSKYLKAVRDAQVQVNNLGLQGRTYGSDKDQATYADAQKQAENLAKHYASESPAFKQMWQGLTESVGDPLVGTLFFPDSYFGPAWDPNYGG